MEFPDLPGCLTCGATTEEAIVMARDALALHLWSMEDDGDQIPDFADLRSAPGQLAALVDVWTPDSFFTEVAQ